MDWFDICMYVISVIGNFGIYFQLYKFIVDRKNINWESPGNTSLLVSYWYSTFITCWWIAYGVINNSTTVLVSSAILLGGDLLCIGSIYIACIVNARSNEIDHF